MDLAKIALRLVLACIFGAILGVEREIRRRPAGLRTYMLVCVGSALVMITNGLLTLDYPMVDPSRMGAQVISGIGFLGAGTIIVTGKNRVQGLTTAAGLWATACVGLAVGAGYIEIAAIGCAITFLVVVIIYRVDDKITARSKIMEFYIEFDTISSMRGFIRTVKNYEIKLSNFEVIRNRYAEEQTVSLIVTLRMNKKKSYEQVEALISEISGVTFVEHV